MITFLKYTIHEVFFIFAGGTHPCSALILVHIAPFIPHMEWKKLEGTLVATHPLDPCHLLVILLSTSSIHPTIPSLTLIHLSIFFPPSHPPTSSPAHTFLPNTHQSISFPPNYPSISPQPSIYLHVLPSPIGKTATNIQQPQPLIHGNP